LLIDGSLARRIAGAGITRVALSLDGLAETHNYMRRNPSSFDRICRALPALAEQGIPLNIVTHINRLNFAELPAMRTHRFWPVNVTPATRFPTAGWLTRLDRPKTSAIADSLWRLAPGG
jgi:hypothetical protein